MLFVTGVSIELVDDPRHPSCLATVSITFDGSFIIHGIRLVQAHSGLYVAMPDERQKEPCRSCGHRQPIGKNFCADCGRPDPTSRPKGKTTRDIAHPLNQDCRKMIHDEVIRAFIRTWQRELEYYRRLVRRTTRYKGRLAA